MHGGGEKVYFVLAQPRFFWQRERLNISIGQQKEVQIITDHKKDQQVHINDMASKLVFGEEREESDDKEERTSNHRGKISQ